MVPSVTDSPSSGSFTGWPPPPPLSFLAAGFSSSVSWAVVTPEDAPLLMAGVGVVTAWAAACGVALLLPSRA
jgi:hypothetical protein